MDQPVHDSDRQKLFACSVHRDAPRVGTREQEKTESFSAAEQPPYSFQEKREFRHLCARVLHLLTAENLEFPRPSIGGD